MRNYKRSWAFQLAQLYRHLKAEGYYSSYTHNAKYYTLATIPKFNKHQIWMHGEIGFTKLNNLMDLVVYSIDRSKGGHTVRELSEIVHTSVEKVVRTLVHAERLKRIRFIEGYVYFSLDHSRFQQQLSWRKKRAQLARSLPLEGDMRGNLPGGFSHEEIVTVLTMMINHPRYSLKKLKNELLEKDVAFSDSAFDELTEAYDLARFKKKEHRLLGQLLEHLSIAIGVDRWADHSKTIVFTPQQEICPDCRAKLHSYKKTNPHVVYSVLYGNFLAKAQYKYCPKHAYLSEDEEKVVSYRSEVLAKIVGPSRRYAYDVMTYIGVSRFLQARQIEEICNELEQDYHIPISTTHAGRLSEEFLVRLSCLHTSLEIRLKQLIVNQGGYYLQIDTSTENDSTVFVGLDNLSGLVLLSEKIPSEREEFILPALQKLRRKFGSPCGVMRDMSKALKNAVTTVFPETPQRILKLEPRYF